VATYYVNSAAAGTNAGTSWTNAYTTFGSAVTAATAPGDVILVHKTHQDQIAVDTTYTFLNNVRVICVDKDASDALSIMGTGGWLGNSTANRAVNFGGAYSVYMYGITVQVAGTSGDLITVAATDGAEFTLENCYLWISSTGSTGSAIYFANGANATVIANGLTLRFGHVNNTFSVFGGKAYINEGSISSAGASPTTFMVNVSVSVPGSFSEWCGFDFSHVGSNTLVGNCSVPTKATFSQCKFGSGMTVLGSQTTYPRLSSAEVFVYDCASGDVHVNIGYYNVYGSCLTEPSISYTSGAAAQSWKIVTNAEASYYTPFKTPWVNWYNTGTSSITPRLEILRDGSATAYDNDEVWGEFLAKITPSSTQSSLFSDRMTILGSPAAQDNGTDTWDGENATHWAGKVDSGSALTPAEPGHIRARVIVGAPSSTLYVDPQIRT